MFFWDATIRNDYFPNKKGKRVTLSLGRGGGGGGSTDYTFIVKFPDPQNWVDVTGNVKYSKYVQNFPKRPKVSKKSIDQKYFKYSNGF